MKPHDHRDSWDDADVRHLRELLKRDLTYAEIGAKLGRTKDGIRSKARRLGLR